MANGNRNLVLNCRVTEETLNKIDALRWDGKYTSRADIVESVFKILSEDIDVLDLRNLLYYRTQYRYNFDDWSISVSHR